METTEDRRQTTAETTDARSPVASPLSTVDSSAPTLWGLPIIRGTFETSGDILAADEVRFPPAVRLRWWERVLVRLRLRREPLRDPSTANAVFNRIVRPGGEDR